MQPPILHGKVTKDFKLILYQNTCKINPSEMMSYKNTKQRPLPFLSSVIYSRIQYPRL